MDLPTDLRLALANELANIPQKSIAASAGRLSNRYRGGHPPAEGTFLHTSVDVIAYAAYRLPATFAAIYAALNETRKRLPDWQPRTMLDAGAGPATALWAASAVWPDLARATLLEQDDGMISFGKRLATHARSAVVRAAIWQKVNLLDQWESEPKDLVTTAYVLNELPPLQRETVINKLWSITVDTLLIIEPGTPIGFSHILQARQQLIAAGANIVAPCPHNLPCPMASNDWCHFAQRIARSQLQRQAKQATLSYEDEKFSYIAASRTKGLPIRGRVLRHPQIRPGHIHLELCTPEGLQNSTVTRKDKAAFREARDIEWGNALSPDH
jgi:ribosomal protein RSM22 (predicted rRNA methylase)